MKILVLNGPNLNFLGIRERGVYGSRDYEALTEMLKKGAAERDVELELFQSNSEGGIIDRLQQAYFDRVDGIIINPAAYTHTSVAILDALRAVGLPAVEVHISDVDKREDFRHVSYPGMYCFKTIKGEGIQGYCTAIDVLLQHIWEQKPTI